MQLAGAVFLHDKFPAFFSPAPAPSGRLRRDFKAALAIIFGEPPE
jgi:hypothetical protein